MSDLHAANARYHDDCRKRFMGWKNKLIVSERGLEKNKTDNAFNKVKTLMENDKQKFWNSIEIYNCYLQNKGTVLLRRDLVTQLSNAFGKELKSVHK